MEFEIILQLDFVNLAEETFSSPFLPFNNYKVIKTWTKFNTKMIKINFKADSEIKIVNVPVISLIQPFALKSKPF